MSSSNNLFQQGEPWLIDTNDNIIKIVEGGTRIIFLPNLYPTMVSGTTCDNPAIEIEGRNTNCISRKTNWKTATPVLNGRQQSMRMCNRSYSSLVYRGGINKNEIKSQIFLSLVMDNSFTRILVKTSSCLCLIPFRFFSSSKPKNEKITNTPLETKVLTCEKVNIAKINDASRHIKISYSQVFDIASLVAGYDRTKANISGIDAETKADISEVRLKNLIKDLRRQTYKPKPNKKISIPKPGGGVRYLGIASAIDKVVQGTILNLLEPLTESIFYDNNGGFRPRKGCHDLLHKIKYG